MDAADRAFASAKYEEAAREYDAYLKLTPPAAQRDEALFRLGLTYALRADWTSAAAHLIHGSSEGRFTIRYCPGHLTQQEIESVHFEYGDLAMRPLTLREIADELNRMQRRA